MTERERLIELLKIGGKLAVEENHKYIREFVKNHGRYNSKTDNNVPFDAIVADYLLENGVVVTPVRVGNTAYMLYWDDECPPMIEKAEILEVSTQRFWIDSVCFDFDDIGKRVFLTEDDAEKEIERRTAQNGLAYATPNFELLEG